MMNFLLCKEDYNNANSEHSLVVVASFTNVVEAELFANNFYSNTSYCIYDMIKKEVVVNNTTIPDYLLKNSFNSLKIC